MSTVRTTTSGTDPSEDRPDGTAGTAVRAARLPTTMEAIVQHGYGGVETLELDEVPVPCPGTGQVLVEVRAAGLDRGTWHLMTGLPYLVRPMFGLTGPRQPIPGLDVAGVVVAVGPSVTRFRPGDEVFGMAAGSFAPYALADQDKLAAKPAGIGFDEAAVVPVSGSTALQALTEVGRLRPGQRVLVVGASGGVGTHAVQLARALGGTVTGVASAAKLDRVRALGAAEVIDYAEDGLRAAIDGGGRWDLIIDIGGRSPVRLLRRALTTAGTLVIVGGEDGGRLTGGLGRQLGALLVSPLVSQKLTFFISEEHHTWIEWLGAHLEAGELVAPIDRRFDLADVPAAMAELEAGRVTGKLAITVPHPYRG